MRNRNENKYFTTLLQQWKRRAAERVPARAGQWRPGDDEEVKGAEDKSGKGGTARQRQPAAAAELRLHRNVQFTFAYLGKKTTTTEKKEKSMDHPLATKYNQINKSKSAAEGVLVKSSPKQNDTVVNADLNRTKTILRTQNQSIKRLPRHLSFETHKKPNTISGACAFTNVSIIAPRHPSRTLRRISP